MARFDGTGMRHDGRRIWRATAAALLCCGWAAGAIPACGYEVEIVAFDCGYPLGTSGAFAYGLAPSGTVVGAFWDCQLLFYHAFLWPPGGGMQIVPYPPQVYSMELFDANDVGQAVGTLFEEDGYWSEAFLFDKGVVTPLGVLPGAIASEALAVNAQGVAVGWSGFSARLPRHAVVWEQDGRIIDVGADLGTPLSEATDVADSGLVTGWMGLSPVIDAVPFIWNAGTVVELPLLPEPGTISTICSAINDAGNCCGWGIMPDPIFALDSRAYAYINGRALSLGTLTGYENSGATDINNHNQVVGSCEGGGPVAAFIWDAGKMQSLTDLIDYELDLHIVNAYAISDAGVITGEAVDASGDSFAVRLRPRQAVGADLNCDGLVGTADLMLLISHWGICAPIDSCLADLNADGVVNGYDLGILLGSWG